MAFSSLTIARSDIDYFKGQTFQDVNVTSGGSSLNISEFDDETLSRAKDELETDILEKTTDFLRNDNSQPQQQNADEVAEVLERFFNEDRTIKLKIEVR